MLSKVLQDNGFTAKEAKVYLAALELSNAPASSIARRVDENRVTTYSILKNLIKKGIAHEIIKEKTTYYSVISSKQLAQKFEDKIRLFKNRLPEFLAMENKFDNKPQVQLFEGLEGLKNIYEGIILHGGDDMEKNEPYLTFTGTGDIDPAFQEYLVNVFAPWRLKFPRKTKSILARNYKNRYIEYHTKKHDYLTINDPIFDFSDEIVIYGKDKVAMAMYNTNEMCGLIIISKTLHDGLKSMFNLIWKLYKK